MMLPVRGRAPSRPAGPVALRVPHHLKVVKASPRLFVHEGARQALERRLQAVHPHPVSLAITDNRHAIITHKKDGPVLRARVHHMFLDAPRSVQNALVRYVRHGDATASALLGHYIEANGNRIARRSRSLPLHTKGKHHDLLAIFDQLNARYFDGQLSCLVTWGSRTTRPGQKRKTIKLGSYSAQDRLIRIHPALDRRWVPRYFVAFVMFHEMLHHVMPGTRGTGRRNLHPPEFLEREREYRFYERAVAWEKSHIGRLLRS